MSSIGSFGKSSTSATLAPTLTVGKIENDTIAAANIEQSHTFPVNTQEFLIKSRGNGTIKLSFDSGTSGTSYLTVGPGCFYSQDNIAAASLTIYYQSPTSGLVVELSSWS